jgi:hypothetical protein
MPAVSPSPITPVTPSVPGLSLSGQGSTFAASGEYYCQSSLGFDCSGPWMVETQRMDIQYVRMPVYSASSTTFNLTSPQADYRVGYTFLQSLVTAEYKVEKVYQDFSTSAFQQPQTFEWYPASSDSYGNTYGAVGASALGPAGNVQTVNQWYNRKPWVSGVDTEVLKHMEGMKSFEIQQEWGSPYNTQGGINNFGAFKHMRNSGEANTFLSDSEYYIFGDQDYFLMGQYITTLENPTNIVNYITGLGQDVTNVRYWDPHFLEQTGMPQPASYRVGYTFLQSIVTAEYKVEKVYQDFSTSAFQQPQTFEWFPASADSYGNTYGAVGASALGPAGNIQTIQQWYNRKPWDSTHTEVSKTMYGMRNFERQREWNRAEMARGGLEGFGDFKTTRWSTYANTFLEDSDYFFFGDKDYLLSFQYITTLENPTNIVNYINGLGTAVTNVQYYKPDRAESTTWPSRSEGFAEYSITRHGWY